jgi:hypothetical protein
MNKIEQYLIDLMYNYREMEKDIWLLEDQEHNLDGVVVLYEDPLVVIRTSVMDAPREKEQRLECFSKLLELNGSDMLHGAYALEGEKVVVIDTLEYETMDYSEFRASLDTISLALSQHYGLLSKFKGK